jgi:hypothetical protein
LTKLRPSKAVRPRRFPRSHPSCNMASPSDNSYPQSADPVAGQKRKRLPRALLACESCRTRKLRVTHSDIIVTLLLHLLIFVVQCDQLSPCSNCSSQSRIRSWMSYHGLMSISRTLSGLPLQVIGHSPSQRCCKASQRANPGL